MARIEDRMRSAYSRGREFVTQEMLEEHNKDELMLLWDTILRIAQNRQDLSKVAREDLSKVGNWLMMKYD